MNIRRKMRQTLRLLSSMMSDNPSKGMVSVAWNLKSLDSKIKIWIENGEKTFILSKELIEAFLHTDIPMSMYPSDFKYPFNTFLIEGEGPLFQTDNGTVDILSILFTHSTVAERRRTIFAGPDGKAHDRLEWDVALSALQDTGPGLGLDHMWLNLSNQKTVEETYGVKSMPNDLRGPVQRTEAQMTINIFFNTLMYIHDETRKVEETEERRTRKMKHETGKKSYKKGYIYLRPPKKYKSLSTGTGRKIDSRFIVRGHWRNQRYGKGMAQSKKIWIVPFWKGPEMSEVASRKYKVK